MQFRKWRNIFIGGGFFLVSLCSIGGILAEGTYPADYKPSKPAEKGDTNVLARVLAVAGYMTTKIDAAGGKDSPVCYRNCLTVALNDALKCTESKGSYAASESCEQEASQKMSTCNPKCQ